MSVMCSYGGFATHIWWAVQKKKTEKRIYKRKRQNINEKLVYKGTLRRTNKDMVMDFGRLLDEEVKYMSGLMR